MVTDQTAPERRFNLLAPALAWLVPGLGHYYLGYRARAVLIAAGIGFLYVGGLFIGGVDVIDRRNDFWWYCGQALASPATPLINAWRGGIDERYHALGYNGPPPPEEGDPPPPYTPSFAKVNEIGTLYTTIAGMINALAILDLIALAPAGLAARREEKTT